MTPVYECWWCSEGGGGGYVPGPLYLCPLYPCTYKILRSGDIYRTWGYVPAPLYLCPLYLCTYKAVIY